MIIHPKIFARAAKYEGFMCYAVRRACIEYNYQIRNSEIEEYWDFLKFSTLKHNQNALPDWWSVKQHLYIEERRAFLRLAQAEAQARLGFFRSMLWKYFKI